MKKSKNYLRYALLVVIFCKGYVGALKLWAATVENPTFAEDSAKDAFFTFNIMTPTEWICFGSAVCIAVFGAIAGVVWLADNES